MKKVYQITEQGKKELEAELLELKGRRGEIAEKIAAARDFGDLSENAEYDAAREEQGLVERRRSDTDRRKVEIHLTATGSRTPRAGAGSHFAPGANHNAG